MTEIITITAYIFSLITFSMFVFSYFREEPRTSSTQNTRQTLGDVEQHGAITDMTQLVEALAKLSDSFSKSGRGYALLVSSIFFLLVATVGSGLDSIAAAITS